MSANEIGAWFLGGVANAMQPVGGVNCIDITYDPVIPDPPDTTPPTVTNFDPAAGTAIGRNAELSFDVQDNTGLFRRVVVMAELVGLQRTEVIHDGDGFLPPYLPSSRVTVLNGFRYSARRTGGWPTDILVKVFAIDQGGNEA